MKNIRVLLVQGSDARPDAAQHLSQSGVDVTTEQVASTDSFAQVAKKVSPNVVVADHEHNGITARELVEAARRELPGVPVIIMTSPADQHSAIARVRDGAETVVLRQQLDLLKPAIDQALSVRRPLAKLTRRQLEVLRLVAEGSTTRAIADKLGLSMKTVESHRGAVMKRLGLQNVAEVVRYAVRTGVVPSDMSVNGDRN